MMTIYLKNATYIDWKSLEFKKGHLAVSEQKENSLKFIDSLPAQKNLSELDILLDCDNRFVTRSFGCGHHHIYSTLARGMPAPYKAPGNFMEILKYIWWNLDKNLDLEMIRASALASALFCAKNGVTFIIDHHASPFAIENSLETIKESFEAVGVSSLLCYEMSDRDGKTISDEGLAETENFLKNGNQGLVGLHASFTVGDDLLIKAVDLAAKYNSGLHVHVAEDQADQDDCLKQYNKRVLNRFSEAGVLNFPRTILGHCLHLDEQEKEIFRNSKSWVVENIESNLNNNVGLTDYSKYGKNIMLGTDGMHSDMLRSAKAAFFNGLPTEGISFPDIYQRFRNVHRYLEENQFQGDGDNNLVILDYDTPTEINAENFLGHFIYGSESKHVESVIANGKLIIKDRKLQTMDEEEILSLTKEKSIELWQKLQA